MQMVRVMSSLQLISLSVSLQNPSFKPLFISLLPHKLLFRRPRTFLRPPSASSTLPRTSNFSESFFNGDLEPYLRCSMPNKSLKLAVLLSGGVDSSVALRLLHAAGHSCTAFYLKIWFQVDVPLEVVHLTDEYWKNVVSYIIEEYRCGRTPNPDVLCNTRIKFGAFMDAINSMEFDYVASGHYANVIHSFTDQTDKPSILELSKDMVKDQTYFLSHLSQAQLKRLIFPLGCVTKDEVRRLATIFNLPNKDRKDSQGICFLGKVCLLKLFHSSFYLLKKLSDAYLITIFLFEIFTLLSANLAGRAVGFWSYLFFLTSMVGKLLQIYVLLSKIKFSEFVARHIGEMEGVLLEAETGDFLGKHRGFWFYTIGQRQGLRLPGGPWYVVEKDIKNNVVFVSRDYFSLDKKRRSFRVGSLKWLSGMPSSEKIQLQCKVRHGPGFYNCNLTIEHGEDGCEDIATVHLSEDDQGLAAGQFTAFYQGNTCIGSGVILESSDDQNFPVCSKALEIARLEDKSKLGKPVKIKEKPTETSVTESDYKDTKLTRSQIAVNSKTRMASQEMKSRVAVNWLQKIKDKWLWMF